jgi:hypothetical protein
VQRSSITPGDHHRSGVTPYGLNPELSPEEREFLERENFAVLMTGRALLGNVPQIQPEIVVGPRDLTWYQSSRRMVFAAKRI